MVEIGAPRSDVGKLRSDEVRIGALPITSELARASTKQIGR
jgi:hypothetical protein